MARQRRPFSIRHEGGQSLVVVVLAMGVILGMAAVSIDIAQWYATRHQAQVAADSGALAGANCMAGGGTTTSCATTPGTYVSANKMSSSNAQFNTPAAGDITVTVTATGSNFFSSVLGVSPPTYTETAIASWKPSKTTPCGSSGSTNCDLMFAYNNDACSGGTALTVSVTGTATLTGNIVTNGNLSGSQTGGGQTGDINGNESYGSGSCTSNPSTGKPWQNSPTQATAPISWPIPYTEDFPACSGSACVGGYPPWCTVTHGVAGTWNPTPSNGNIYCDSGTGTPSTPSTWNGAISISAGTSWDATIVGGTISYTGNGGDISSCGYSATGYAPSTSTPCSAPTPLSANYPIFYATGTDPSGSSYAFTMTSASNGKLSGDIFAPNGTAYFAFTGTPTLTTFIEADYINGSFTGTPSGDGPQLNGGSGGSIIPGGDSLIG